MVTKQDHALIRYLIRRPPRSDDDTTVAMNAIKTIRRELGNHIIPFNLIGTGRILISNTGINTKVDTHDLNSWRIDVNVLEPDADNPEMTFEILQSLAFDCKHVLEGENKPRPVRCFLSFELTN